VEIGEKIICSTKKQFGADELTFNWMILFLYMEINSSSGSER
jgi:hypothetical protein